MTGDYEVRPMRTDDIPGAIAVMAETFARRTKPYFAAGFERLSQREIPESFERFGYVIDDDGIRGAVLAIPSRHDYGSAAQVFVNISTWCVSRSHRGPAAKELYAMAAARDDAVITNLSAAKHTIKTIKSLGFVPWTQGQFIALAARRSKRGRIMNLENAVKAGLPDHQAAILRDHANLGCLTPVLESDGRLLPLVILKRRVQRYLPAGQLIYCEDREWLLDRCGPLIRWLRLRGLPGLIVDASGDEPSLRGKYFPDRSAKYTRAQRPKLDIDHTYSEMVYLGF